MKTLAKVALFAVALSLVLWLLPLGNAGAEVVSQGGADKCTNKNCSVLTLTAAVKESIGYGGISTDGGLTLTGANFPMASLPGSTWLCWGAACPSGITGTATQIRLSSTNGVTVDQGITSQAGTITSTPGVFLGNASGTSFYEGNAGAGGTSASIPAVALKATQALTSGFAVAGIQQSDGTNLLRCFQGGGCDIGAAPATVAGSTIDTVGNHTNVWSSYCVQSPCTKAEAAGDSFVMPLMNTGGTAGRVQCNWRTAGTGGTTGVVVAIWNQTDSSELCSCVVQGCAVAIGTVGNCTCSGTFNSAKAYVMRLKSTTDCATIPGGIGCTLSFN